MKILSIMVTVLRSSLFVCFTQYCYDVQNMEVKSDQLH
jgi:hypothetical protein